MSGAENHDAWTDPVVYRHFPDRLHAFVWRNWQLAPLDRMARVVGATSGDLEAIGARMGLGSPLTIAREQEERSYVTVLRRNWHILPHDQLCALLDWPPERLEYTLREGDGLFWWFGQYTPRLKPLRYSPPGAEAVARAEQIGQTIRATLGRNAARPEEPLFRFVEDLSKPPAEESRARRKGPFSPRYCYSYFAPFRNPLGPGADPFPDGYLARLAAIGVDGVILHEPLYHLVEFPWDPAISDGYEERIKRFQELAARAGAHGIRIYLYLNEPRPMPTAFFDEHPELCGVTDRQVQIDKVCTLCTSVPAVQDYLRDGVYSVCRAVPELGGIFTISASESYTNCWSHDTGDECARCGPRGPEEVIAEANTVLWEGIAVSGSDCRFIVWDWGWKDEWAEGIIARLPQQAALQSVSEWSLPINRGGVESTVGEYSISAIGPGPRAGRHWALARERGMDTIAKTQMSTTWELGSVPYLPVVENVAQHVANLRETGVTGLMLSWTLGSYPSPSFEVAMEVCDAETVDIDAAMRTVAARRFGEGRADAVVRAWRMFSEAFKEYPFHIKVLYQSPIHMGPANLLWGEPTGYDPRHIMGFGHPLDGLDAWRGVYPPEVFAEQLDKVASGFRAGVQEVIGVVAEMDKPDTDAAYRNELGVAVACALHFESMARQVRFVLLRNSLTDAKDASATLDAIEVLVRAEREAATRLHTIQSQDSRIGFEAACHYLYIGTDLAEKVLNCDDLLERWLPEQRARLATQG